MHTAPVEFCWVFGLTWVFNMVQIDGVFGFRYSAL